MRQTLPLKLWQFSSHKHKKHKRRPARSRKQWQTPKLRNQISDMSKTRARGRTRVTFSKSCYYIFNAPAKQAVIVLLHCNYHLSDAKKSQMKPIISAPNYSYKQISLCILAVACVCMNYSSLHSFFTKRQDKVAHANAETMHRIIWPTLCVL